MTAEHAGVQLYYFTTAEHGVGNIEKRRIKVARLNALNDPFEWLGPACKRRTDREFLLHQRETMNATHGIVCMSEDFTNPVHWAHYAERHAGICLGFEVDPGVARRITYCSTRTPVDDLSFLVNDPDATGKWMEDEIIYRKFGHWVYEKEWRIGVLLADSIKEGPLYFEPFSAQVKLNKVLLGARCDVNRTTIQRVVGDLPGVEIVRLALAPHEYAMCDERYEHQQ